MSTLKSVHSLEELRSISILERSAVYISEELTTRHPISDCAEPLVEISSQLAEHNQPPPLWPAPDEQCYNGEIWVRSGVFERLLQAAGRIYSDSGCTLGLMIVDGFRPIHVQRRYFTDVQQEVRQRLGADADPQELWKETTKWVADPDLSPPHSSGGAVDCTLFSVANRTALDMGSHWSGSDLELAPASSRKVPEQACKHRSMLVNSMTCAGFVNLATEWWHYSYGDQYWALYHDKAHAIYGPLDLPA